MKPDVFRCFVTLVVTGISLWSGEVSLGDDPPNVPVDFVRDIQPILLSRCSECHGEKLAKSGLRLDVKSAAFAGGDSGKVIVPGQSGNSSLWERISSTGDDRMPPKGNPLTADQIRLVKQWIDQGAKWPDGVDPSKVLDKYDWWSLKPFIRPRVPVSVDPPGAPSAQDGGFVSGGRSPIDAQGEGAFAVTRSGSAHVGSSSLF